MPGIIAEKNREALPTPQPVRSMTGYATVRRMTSAGELTVTLKSVNGRGLDLHFHGNSDFASFEMTARSLIKQQVNRGHVEVRIALARETNAGAGYNRDLLARYVEALEEARSEFGLGGKLNVNSLLALPGLFENARELKPLGTDFETELSSALAECVTELNRFREREGSELVAAIHAEAGELESATAQISAIRETAIPQLEKRLRERLAALLDDRSIPEARVIEEAALAADRSDIHEEITRLSVHAGELQRILATGGEVGKRLDFLLQEMNRETNTVLSKTAGLGNDGLTITSLGLSVKANIERIREQALNLE